MKKIYILLFFTVVSNLFSQNGKIYLKNAKFKIGAENTYVYEPSKELTVPKGAVATILDSFSDEIQYKNLVQKGKKYEFTTKVADSARTIFVIITEAQKIVDSNEKKGYIVYLRTQNETELSKSLLGGIIAQNYANYRFQLNKNQKPESKIATYDSLYAKYPDLKKDKTYMSYLYLKNMATPGQNKDIGVAFANVCLQKNTESDLVLATQVYELNNMSDEKEKLEKEILAKYPSGSLAKTKFIGRFYNHKDKTEEYVLKSIDTCKTKYKDSSKETLSSFYSSLLYTYLEEKNMEKIKSIEPYVYNADYSYNNFAWGLSGGDLTMPVQQIDFATNLSKRSLDLLEEKKNKGFYPDYQGLYNMYADTYALLLYKQGKFNEAFEYQNNVKNAGGLDTGGKERYLAMMQKVKSKEEVRNYIENEINSNKSCPPVFISTLKQIYIVQNLPLDQFEKLKDKFDKLAQEEKAKKIIDQFGSKTPTDFVLKNMDGKEVKLSDYKGKVVVLDFWATWCGPCKASFPKMQELVTKYKEKEVTFLFINTFENKKEDEVFKNVTNYITEKKYTFNVVFDSKNEVATTYKVEGIPTRVLIGKNGDILFSDHSNTSLAELIDEQLK
ncbi:TlpA family protein disulfide reductase [Flavobacterium phragmitis]|uniref:Thiol-disulfide isomerase or thioredoxin n=1 Tax=Flavobacterium phragmitis TaxID=739143 RepID=A0A1I1PIJ4_9FLAO|nr:TlpA disulfide reductase family protein [Flavobacterium phragmitis]SFD09674.1 Thiol-disulfide isomerase or thioredoxin [Flavobacterium phragmitis]